MCVQNVTCRQVMTSSASFIALTLFMTISTVFCSWRRRHYARFSVAVLSFEQKPGWRIPTTNCGSYSVQNTWHVTHLLKFIIYYKPRPDVVWVSYFSNYCSISEYLSLSSLSYLLSTFCHVHSYNSSVNPWFASQIVFHTSMGRRHLLNFPHFRTCAQYTRFSNNDNISSSDSLCNLCV